MAAKTKKKDEDESLEVELVVAQVQCRIDVRALDYGEMAEVEEIFGKPWDQVLLADFNSAKGTILLAYLARRRVDPTFTLDHARRLKPGEIEVKDARPTETPDADGSPS